MTQPVRLNLPHRHAAAGQPPSVVVGLEIADDREEDPASRRVRIETRLKLLAKWDPKRYGDRLQAELTGANGGPVRSEVTMASPETMAELTQALLSAAKGGEK